ncbi:Protein of unknown function [Alkalibacterium putridalgicola]|uniref:DUF2922 domain-containing protein n=1 Tax=Alkalibacterium putridalgicola TaxID=426703 RepID=A0A1H7WM19_9LACT|nr:DUF2922 domain-containing protein [Alkalibacterium putridalgicola]GEK90098.1 hypothetical protein APU01nite_21370 [Alkalibacterium putridalgicola]SEM22394.1 Protein of unknown function [Alkalibacterium putridalgicola]
MAKRLELRFETGEGKIKVIGIDQPVENLDPLVVQTAMEQIIGQDMFEVEGIKQFTKIKDARYVTRTVDDIIAEA